MSKRKRTQPSVESAPVDRLVASLRAGGEPVGAGEASEFTLDREVAARKLSEFQLPRLEYFVLLWVRALVLGGATRIDVTCSSERMYLTALGAQLTLADFERLYSAALSSQGDPRTQVRRLLALGLSALSQVSPRFMEVRAEGDGAAARLYTEPHRPDRFEALEPPAPGTDARVTMEVVIEHADELLHRATEALRRRCVYAEIPVFLEGERLSGGLHLEEAVATVPLEDGGARGEGGFQPNNPTEGEVRLVRDGIWLVTRQQRLGRGFVVVLQDDGLRTDLSGFDLVRDKRFDSRMAQLRELVKRSRRQHKVKRLSRAFIKSEARARLERIDQEYRHRRHSHVPLMLLGVGGVGAALYLLVGFVLMPLPLWAAVAGGLLYGIPALLVLDRVLGRRLLMAPLARRINELLPPGTPLRKRAHQFALERGPTNALRGPLTAGRPGASPIPVEEMVRRWPTGRHNGITGAAVMGAVVGFFFLTLTLYTDCAGSQEAATGRGSLRAARVVRKHNGQPQLLIVSSVLHRQSSTERRRSRRERTWRLDQLDPRTGQRLGRVVLKRRSRHAGFFVQLLAAEPGRFWCRYSGRRLHQRSVATLAEGRYAPAVAPGLPQSARIPDVGALFDTDAGHVYFSAGGWRVRYNAETRRIERFDALRERPAEERRRLRRLGQPVGVTRPTAHWQPPGATTMRSRSFGGQIPLAQRLKAKLNSGSFVVDDRTGEPLSLPPAGGLLLLHSVSTGIWISGLEQRKGVRWTSRGLAGRLFLATVVGEVVVLVMLNDRSERRPRSYAVGLDARTGRLRWHYDI